MDEILLIFGAENSPSLLRTSLLGIIRSESKQVKAVITSRLPKTPLL